MVLDSGDALANLGPARPQLQSYRLFFLKDHTQAPLSGLVVINRLPEIYFISPKSV